MLWFLVGPLHPGPAILNVDPREVVLVANCTRKARRCRFLDQDSETADLRAETVGQQVAKVMAEVKMSHVQQYGDKQQIAKQVPKPWSGTWPK